MKDIKIIFINIIIKKKNKDIKYIIYQNTMFPLYEQLTEQLPEIIESLTDNKKQYFLSSVATLTNVEHEIIFALIRSHQIKMNNTKFYILPYNAKNQKKGIKFDFDMFPVELQHILILFIEKHMNMKF